MSDGRGDSSADEEALPAANPGDVESAGRSCVVILALGAAILLLLCVGIAARWATG